MPKGQRSVTRLASVATGACLMLCAPGVAHAALSAPSSVVANTLSGSIIQLSWLDSNTTETGYSVERSLSATTGFIVVANTAVDATTYRDTGLASSTTYYYRVRALASGTVSAYSNVTSATTADTTSPSVPTSLRVTSLSCTQATLAWNPSSDVGTSGVWGYGLFRDGVVVAWVLAPATSATDTALSGSRTYNYTVEAFDNAGNGSAQSGTLAVTTPACSTTTTTLPPVGSCGSPTVIPAQGGTFSGATSGTGTMAGSCGTSTNVSGETVFQWTPAVSGAATIGTCGSSTTFDTVLYMRSGSCTAGTEISCNDDACTNSTGNGRASRITPTVTAGQTYFIVVDGYSGSGGNFALTVTPPASGADTAPPSVPTGLAGAAASCGQINLGWAPSTDTGGSGLRGYNVYRNGFFVKQVFAPGTSTTDTGVAASTRYSYTLTAFDNAGNVSAQSAPAYVATPACATITTTSTTTTTTTLAIDRTAPSVPTGVSASSANCSQINVGWSASTDTGGSGLRGYNVYRNGSFLKQVFAPAASTSDVGLAGSTVYSYAIAAFDNAGNVSALSATASTNTPACPDTTAPSMPTGLAVSAPSCSQTNLAWNASSDTGSSGLAGYKLYRNGALLKQIAAPATSTTDTGVAASTAYSYAVAAYDNAGNTSALGAAASATTPACTTSLPGLIGYVPDVGTPNDVIVNSATGLAYIASSEFGLAVLNLANPASPVVMGGATPPFYGYRVAMAGTLASVAGGSTGMKVVDISNPSVLRTVGSLSGTVNAVAMAGQYVYAAQVVPGNPPHTDLITVSVATPSSPTVVGRVTLSGSITDVAMVGSLVYVTGSAGLQIVTVSTPSTPTIIGSLAISGTPYAAAVSGSYAYVAAGTSVQIVNVATPSRPFGVGTFATTASGIQVAGGRLYVLDGIQFKIADLANPAAPALLSANNGYGASRLALYGTTALLASSDVTNTQGGLYLFNVSSATTPSMLANLYHPFANGKVASAGSLAVATGGSRGMRIVDIGTPASPRTVASLNGTMNAVAMAGQYAYVAQVIPGNPPHTDLVVMSLAVPSSPAVVGRVTLAGPATDVVVVGSLVYVPETGVGLQIVNVTTPAAPTIVGTVTFAGSPYAVCLAGNYAYVADGSSVQIINVATPSRPVVAGSLPITAWAVVVSGTRLYVLDGPSFTTADITNPTAPTVLSTTNGYYAQGIAISGTRAFLATPAANHFDVTGGIYVLDVSTATPRLLEQIIVPGTTSDVVATTTGVFAVDAAGVIDVIK